MVSVKIRLATTLALLFTLSACGPTAIPINPVPTTDDTGLAPLDGAELIARGETMAETLCATCHAVGRTGESPHREAIPLRELSWNYPVEDLAEPFAEGIMVGHPDMPQWQFEPMDIDALLAYIESIQIPRET